MAETLEIPCPQCGARNRIHAARMQPGRAPVCGRCKTPLPMGGAPLIVTDATFADKVERAARPVLVDFWAPWCGPCRMVSPIVDELAAEFAGRLQVAKMNVDDNPVVSSRFDIRSIPALLLFRGGREAGRNVGAQPKAELRKWIERTIQA